MDTVLAVLSGVPLTILVTVAAMALGALLAVPLTLGLRSRSKVVWFVCRGIVDLFRGVPQLVWLFIVYYGITFGGIRVDALPAGIIALGVVASGYLAEIFRGALKAVNAGQWEASKALGFSSAATWLEVVAPQAGRIAVPGSTNYAIALLKDSAIVSTIGVAEITSHTGALARASDAGIYIYLIGAVIYILISVPLGVLSRAADTRMRAAVAR